jgi:hypothetical protein
VRRRNGSETVIWSILTEQAWDELQQKGRLAANSRHVDNEDLAAYAWMVSQMERRLTIPKPSDDTMPIWAWWQWLGDRHRPDLRAGWHLPKGTRGVRVELHVENDRVLLSDFELWHYVLNYWYLPKSEKEGESFEKKLTRVGLSVHGCSHQKPLAHVKFRREVERSWERIFDLSWTDPEHNIVHRARDRSIQGTMWELLLEDVVDTTEFTAR